MAKQNKPIPRRKFVHVGNKGTAREQVELLNSSQEVGEVHVGRSSKESRAPHPQKSQIGCGRREDEHSRGDESTSMSF